MHKLGVRPLATAAFLLILPLAAIVVRQSQSDPGILTPANTAESGGGPMVAPLIALSSGEATGEGAAIELESDYIAGRCDEGAHICAASGAHDPFSPFTVATDQNADFINVDAEWADAADEEAADAASLAGLLDEEELAAASIEEADVLGESAAESIASRADDSITALDDNGALATSDAAFIGDVSLAASLLPAADGGSTAPSTRGSSDTGRNLPGGRGEERIGGGGSDGSGGADGPAGTPSSPPDAHLSGSRPPTGSGAEPNGRPSSLPPGGVLSVPDSLQPFEGGPETGRPQGNTRVLESGIPHGDVRGSISGVPSPAQTPELGSLGLFGAGAVSMAGYALTRLRASRRRGPPSA